MSFEPKYKDFTSLWNNNGSNSSGPGFAWTELQRAYAEIERLEYLNKIITEDYSNRVVNQNKYEIMREALSWYAETDFNCIYGTTIASSEDIRERARKAIADCECK